MSVSPNLEQLPEGDTCETSNRGDTLVSCMHVNPALLLCRRDWCGAQPISPSLLASTLTSCSGALQIELPSVV